MQNGAPSRTARAAAFHRAAHQVLEHGRIFTDPLAIAILGETAESVARKAEEKSSGRRMRLFIAVRTRFAEDTLARAVENGVTQLVVLGAGLDTYAYRGAQRHRLRIFEVDHPATQAWKRQRLIEVGIPIPHTLTFAPVNFEKETLAVGLAAAGFDPRQQTFFTWLGVVPYLTKDSVTATLGYLASLPIETHVVFDYSNPPADFAPEMQTIHQRRAAHVAELGEPWINYYDSLELKNELNALGFSEIEDLGPPEIMERYFPNRATVAADKGGHILHAATSKLAGSQSSCR